MKLITGVAVAGMAFALAGCRASSVDNWPPRFHEPRSALVEAPPGPIDVHATTGFGDVDIQPHGAPMTYQVGDTGRMDTMTAEASNTKQAQILAVVRSPHEDRIAGVQIVTRLTGSTLTLDAKWPGARRDHEGVDWIVRLPQVGGEQAATGFGDVTVTSPTGDVTIGTGFGDAQIRDAHQAVRVESGFGDLMVDSARGPVDAQTEFGDVGVRRAHQRVRAISDHGDLVIALTPDNGGPVDLVTDFGDITLAIGPAFAGEVTIETDFGDISADHLSGRASVRSIKDDRMTLAFTPSQQGEPPAASRVVTDHGDISITDASD